MSCFASDLNMVVAYTLASGLECAFESLAWFEHKHCLATPGYSFSDRPRRFASYLFVSVQQNANRARQLTVSFEQLNGIHRHHNSGFHVEDTRPPDAIVGDAEGHLGQCAEVPNCIDMSEQQHWLCRNSCKISLE